MIRRYEVHDEDGPLRTFYTRKEAEEFKQEGWRIVVLPKPVKKTNKELIHDLEDAKW